jgi:uncharacterized protein (TIGR04255 family)
VDRIEQREMAFRYENAPITEALIDITVSDTTASLADLETLQTVVADTYPIKKKRATVEGAISGGAEVSASAKQTYIGPVFVSGDGLQVIQARLDGFSFSRLRPYVSWVELRDEARRLWGFYRDVAKTVRVIGLAVRNVNQIDIPGAIDYKDYFRTTPEVASDLPQSLSSFMMQLQFPHPKFDGHVVLTQASVPPPIPGYSSVVLDINAMKVVHPGTTEDEIWSQLEILRECKNQFFEGSITDKTRALFGRREEY